MQLVLKSARMLSPALAQWVLIGASLSEPHTSVIALRVACVCMCVCMFACGHIPEI